MVIIASLILGGGTRPGFLSDVILQLISLPLLLVVLWQSLDQPTSRQMRWAYAFCFALITVPFIQLIPLPPAIWTLLSNREPIALSYDLVGHDLPWRPISVSPHATWLSLISLIPPVSIFLAILMLSHQERRQLSLIIIALGLISVFLGLIQVAQGPESSLRFFDYTNLTEAVGFFANRNHYSALLYSVMLFAAVWVIAKMNTSSSNVDEQTYDTTRVLILLAGFTIIVAFIGAQTIARSRAGLGLTIVALIGIVALSLAKDQRANRSDSPSLFILTPTKLMAGATLLAVIFATQFALFRVMERFAKDPLTDARIPFTRNTLEAAEAFIPFGSGMGSFVQVYGIFEKPEDALASAYGNRAHNDIAEIWLETGGMGAMLMALFLIWLIWRAYKIWRSPDSDVPEINRELAKAASIVIFLLIAHSLVDYPLRTGAIMAIMAFACGILIDPVRGHAPDEEIIELNHGQIRPSPQPNVSPHVSPRTQPVDVEWPIEGRQKGAPPQAPYQPPSPEAWPQEQETTPTTRDTDPQSPWLDEIEWPVEWEKQAKPEDPSEG